MAAQITALPTPPSRSDPVNFSARADAFLGQLPLFQTEANALATEAESNALLAETKRNEASTFASNALASANAAAASFDSFDDRYLGPKASAPTLDNDGQALLVGALYFDTTLNRMRVRNNANNAWIDAYYTDENLTVTNLQYTGTLTGSTGVINIGSNQFYKDAAGNIGLGTATPNFPVTINNTNSLIQFVNSNTGTASGNGVKLGLGGAGSLEGFFIQEGNANLTIINRGATANLIFGTNNTEAMRINSAGNAGLGVTPSAWRAQDRAFQIRQTVLHDVNNTGSVFSQNNYLDSSSVFRYINSDFASQYIQNAGASGTHAWFTAPSGTAGAPITFTQVMTLSPSSQLVLNRPTGGAASLEVTGTNGGAQPFIQLQAGTAFRLQSIIGGGITFNQVDVGEAARITSARYFKASNTGGYGGVAGITDQSSSSVHVFQSNQENSTLVAINSNTGIGVLNFTSALAAGAAGSHFSALVNGTTVFRVLANGSVEGQTETAGTNNTRLASTAFVKNAVDSAALGVGQTWQDVTGSRAIATNYTNTTGKPIMVNVTMLTINSATVSQLIVSGVIVAEHSANIGGGANSNLITTMSAIVPAGAVYSATGTSLRLWTELRV